MELSDPVAKENLTLQQELLNLKTQQKEQLRRFLKVLLHHVDFLVFENRLDFALYLEYKSLCHQLLSQYDYSKEKKERRFL